MADWKLVVLDIQRADPCRRHPVISIDIWHWGNCSDNELSCVVVRIEKSVHCIGRVAQCDGAGWCRLR